VVGSVALLLGGALFGLTSYVKTMQTTERKLDEMQMVTQLRDRIHGIGSAGQRQKPPNRGSQLDWEKEQTLTVARDARKVLQIYKETLTNQTREYDPDGGESESRMVERLEQLFDAHEEAIERASGPGVGTEYDRLGDDPRVKSAYEALDRTATDLFMFLVADVKESFDRANANHQRSLTIAGFATALSVILVLTLLYYFRVWVFAPIQQLQAGVQRVHGGDFDHPIRLASRDELEELANEFNAMTARLRDVYQNLALQVNERTRQLVRSERMVSVGFLAAGVAHEINNPLASIAFCAEALERRLQDVLVRAPGEAEVVTKYLRMMQDEAQRCKQITQKLLDFSRSGGRREMADLTRLVQDVIEVAECLPNARSKRIVFQPGSPLAAPVSVPDVKGVVLNLVVNALDSMEEGGLLTVATATRGEFAEVTFADSGCGMTPEILENIFEPFFTRSRTGNGTGLGLSISHQIIDQHGGTITAASPGPGRGSTFTVRLPLRAVEVRPEPRDQRPEPDGERQDVVPFPAVRTAA
jgi:signal transduction histidine kinase